MLTAQFSDANQTTVTYLNAIETEEFYNGSSRRTLTFECAPDAASVDALNVLISAEANVADVTLTNDDLDVSNVYSDYVLKLKVGIEPKLVASDTPDAPAVYEDRLIIKLGKRTYIEQRLHELEIG